MGSLLRNQTRALIRMIPGIKLYQKCEQKTLHMFYSKYLKIKGLMYLKLNIKAKVRNIYLKKNVINFSMMPLKLKLALTAQKTQDYWNYLNATMQVRSVKKKSKKI